MENTYIIEGGKALKGSVTLSGAKNVALKILIASLLFDDEVTVENIPDIGDIRELISLIENLGATVQFTEKNTITINPKGLKKTTVDLLAGSKIRVSFMLFAPLLARFGKATIPNPGGCRLGSRPIDRHVSMMQAFGVHVSYDSKSGYYQAKMKEPTLHKARYKFTKPTHTGTELALLFAVLTKGQSVIENAAQEPEIDDLINFLNQNGADISRVHDKIVVHGGKKLQFNNIPYKIMNDRNEAPTYAAFGLATKGDVTVLGVAPSDLHFFIDQVKKAGGGVEKVEGGIRFYYKGPLKKTDIITRPHPGFMTDWQGPWAVIMTQANGISTIHETVFENRFSYVSELKKLGAKIDFFQPKVDNPPAFYEFNYNEREDASAPQGIRIFGPTRLHNGVLNVADLRAGASLLIAAAVSHGESIISGASVIDRGYEHIDQKLKALGAKIKKI